MPAVAREQPAAGFERAQQMEGGDRATRAVRLAVVVGKNERRPAIAFDDAGSGNADHPPVPTVAIDDHAVGVAQRRFLLKAAFDRFKNTALFFLAFAVELVEASRDLMRSR